MQNIFVSFGRLSFLICSLFPVAYAGPADVKKKSAENIEAATVKLEEEHEQTAYCLKNIGNNFKDINTEKIGRNSRGLYEGIGYVTYGLVAFKQRNPQKAAEYFYKDWLEFKKSFAGKDSVWHEGPGDYDPLRFAIGSWEEAGLYDKALGHYQEYFDDTFLMQPGGGTLEEKQKRLKEELLSYPALKAKHDEFMKDWEMIKKLAKTGKPKPLDPAVQNHEWFYSDKPDEVMKALEYYHANKVGFMLEKALTHKDPKVAAKAKEYLGDLKKQ